MKNVILILSSILLIACTSQKKVTNTTATANVTNQKKESKMYGKVVVKSKPSNNGNSEMPVFYFNMSGVDYRINFKKSKVSKTEIQKYLFKDIDVLGETKVNVATNTPLTNGASEEENQKVEEGLSIVIYKIIE
ncbi:MAG: hypothetical protein ACPGSL_08935 [Vicingaceae bacterium]